MRKPSIVLQQLQLKAEEKNYIFQRLYRNLYNPRFLALSYENVTGKNAPDFTLLIHSLKDQTYTPTPKKTPLQNIRIEDLVVQETVKVMLNSIFEPRFSVYSHGYRPNRSCHTALQHVQQSFTDAVWIVKFDLKNLFFTINHHILIEIARKTVQDEKLLHLISRFLKAGYLEDWRADQTYSETLKGGLLSPILSNLYFNELDQYLEKLMDQKQEVPIFYVRYAHECLLGITGSKDDTIQIIEKISIFLHVTLDLNVDKEMIQISHHSQAISFLGYYLTRGNDKVIQLRIPKAAWMKMLFAYKAMKIDKKGDWRALHRGHLLSLKDKDILLTYNKELRGLYMYYKLAVNVGALHHFHYIMEKSMLKTYANKYKTTTKKIRKRMTIQGNIAVVEKSKQGKRVFFFRKKSYPSDEKPIRNMKIDDIR